MSHPFASPSDKAAKSSLGQKFGGNGRTGDTAERAHLTKLKRFAASVGAEFGEDPYEVVHSLDIPQGRGDRKAWTGDVDFAIASGKSLVLIDVKHWRPGMYWSVPTPPEETLALLGIKNKATKRWFDRLLGKRIAFRGISPHVEDKFVMSKNMHLALERYRERLGPEITVSALVVFVHEADSWWSSVALLVWPGGIRSCFSRWSFDALYDRLGRPSPVDPEVQKLLNRMQRNSGGK